MKTVMTRALPIVALLPLAGCPLFSASVEIPEVCVLLHDNTVEGVKPGENYRRKIVADPLSDLGAFATLDGNIKSARVTLHATSVPDLMFLGEVNLSVRSTDPRSELAPMWLVRCPDFACASPTADASASAHAPSEAVEYFTSGGFQLDITMSGPLPENDWKVDVEVCMSGSADVGVGL